MKDNAELFIKASSVNYIQNTKLRGSLFDSKDTGGLISSVDTGFLVDHREPLQALTWAQEMKEWHLGELLDGLGFLVVIQAKRRLRNMPTGHL